MSGHDGLRVAVTGGASGIGAEVVKQLTSAGASVLAADLDTDGLATLARTTGCATATVDVADPAGNENLIDLLIEHGRFEEARVAAKRLRHNLTAAELAGPIGIQILAREGLALWGAGRMAELEQTVTIARENANGKDIAVGADQVDVVAFLEALAEGGHRVGKGAQMLFRG